MLAVAGPQRSVVLQTFLAFAAASLSQEPASKPKWLVVLTGASFRDGGRQGVHTHGNNSAAAPQLAASKSHVRLLQRLSSLSVAVDTVAVTYRNAWTRYLDAFYTRAAEEFGRFSFAALEFQAPFVQ
eukprot:TRINITY_DN57611_c0_g2_i1.p2 TRINITY_DN57611_c0_g2~~TRINITY_DN57611_c0_g2_i1.p2  ORF type:complete len:127 (-),score=11.70 TRINITY_DN57611_c0_g2_i1:378-758(-)